MIEAELVELGASVPDLSAPGRLVGLLTLGAALVVALRLRRRIAEPILRLAMA